MKHIKCVVVGDKSTEKNRFLITYTTKSNPGEYLPTVFDNYSVNVMFENQAINLQLWDTTGQEDYEKLRPLSYAQADVFIVLFSLVKPETLNNVGNIWIPEIRKHSPGTPYILVGIDKNLRDNYTDHQKDYKPISTERGNEIKQNFYANEYIECDMENIPSIEEAFNLAIKCSLYRIKNISQLQNDDNNIVIGLYGSYNKYVAINYAFGKLDEIAPLDIDIFKITEIHNETRKLTFQFDFSDDFYLHQTKKKVNVNVIIFLFDANSSKSFDKLDLMIGKIKKIKVPFFLVLHNMTHSVKLEYIEAVKKLMKKIKYELIEARLDSNNDIEELFYYILKKIPLKIIKKKKKTKIKKPKQKKLY